MDRTQTVGTCSLCGGAVTVPWLWMSVVPAVPQCTRCGATAAMHGPVIPMVRQQQPATVPAPFFEQDTGTAGNTWEWLPNTSTVTWTVHTNPAAASFTYEAE